VRAVRDEPQPLQAHLILKLWFRLFAANGSFWANRKADRALNPIFARFIPSTAAFSKTLAKRPYTRFYSGLHAQRLEEIILLVRTGLLGRSGRLCIDLRNQLVRIGRLM
jgi:hypothetical protein